MFWNRAKVKAALQATGENVEITDVDSTGGDWDIFGLRATLEGVDPAEDYNAISITPYQDPNFAPLEKMDDCDVYAIEVRTNGDSRGGCQTGNRRIGHLYQDVKMTLEEMKFRVIGHYDEIF